MIISGAIFLPYPRRIGGPSDAVILVAEKLPAAVADFDKIVEVARPLYRDRSKRIQ